jgi:hypothetical protein
MSLSIILSFCVLLMITLLALLWSSWPAWLKSMLIVAVTGLYFFGHDAVLQIWGIPSTEALPERFVMLASIVEEPSQKTQGAIYMWVSEPRDGKSALAPRAYKLRYTKDLHTQVDEGLRRGRDGVSQMGTAEAKAGSGKGMGFLRPGNDEQEIKVRDLPVPQMPEK